MRLKEIIPVGEPNRDRAAGLIDKLDGLWRIFVIEMHCGRDDKNSFSPLNIIRFGKQHLPHWFGFFKGPLNG
jgi:hypothetical protein